MDKKSQLITLLLTPLAFFLSGAGGKVEIEQRLAANTKVIALDSNSVSQGLEIISMAKASELAEIHLSLRNYRWGKPSNIQLSEDRFLLYYDTPSRELPIIGARRVSVSRLTGVVKMRP